MSAVYFSGERMKSISVLTIVLMAQCVVFGQRFQETGILKSSRHSDVSASRAHTSVLVTGTKKTKSSAEELTKIERSSINSVGRTEREQQASERNSAATVGIPQGKNRTTRTVHTSNAVAKPAAKTSRKVQTRTAVR